MDNNNKIQEQNFNKYYQDQAHKQTIKNGWLWIADAWYLFRANTLKWLFVSLIFIALHLPIIYLNELTDSWYLSLVLSILLFSLAQIFWAGVYYCTHNQKFEYDFEIYNFFVGFKQQTGKLIGSGIIIALMYELLEVVVFGLENGSFINFFEAQEQLQEESTLGFFGWSLITVLNICILMMSCLSVPLIFFNKLSVFEALKKSLQVCVNNIGTFFVYMLVIITLFLLAALPLGLGLILMMPVFTISLYTMYISIFYSNTDNNKKVYSDQVTVKSIKQL